MALDNSGAEELVVTRPAAPKSDRELEQPRPKQWEWLATVPIVAGLCWLLAGSGGAWLFWALVPGCFLLTTGMALMFLPGDPRIYSLMAGAGIIGAVFTLPAWYVGGSEAGFLVLLGSVASFLVAGRTAVSREPLYLGATPPCMDTKMDAKAALDEAVLGYFLISAQVPSGEEAATMCKEAFQLEHAFRARGWLDDPATMHQPPPAPDKTFVDRGRIFGHDYEVLSFDSAFDPDETLPGARLWQSHTRNARCHVRIMRHAGAPRPWLMCLHGYRMGVPLMDFSLFAPSWLHERLGLNIIQPVLPLHGPRKIGWRTGDYYLDGDLMDLVYAQAQALWDLRRTLAWLHTVEENPRVGVFGFSLGGYNAALLAAFEERLDFIVAGIPVVDYARALWRFMPPSHLHFFRGCGLDEERYRTILRVVSPLCVKPRIAQDHLHIFGATGDRIVLPEHPLRLSEHWGVPVSWYQGSHLSVRNERATHETLHAALARVGWTPPAG